MGFDWGDLSSVATGGIFGGGGTTQSTTGLLSGYGPAAKLFGIGQGVPNNYDAAKNLATAQANTQATYDRAMAASGAAGAGWAHSEEQAKAIQAPNAIQAQTIGTPTTVAGPAADALRAQQLQAASDAMNAPSAAQAQLASGQQLVARQQLAVAAGARGADRAAAKRDAMMAIGQQGMQASQNAAALAATEQQARTNANINALAGIRAGDVSTAGVQTQIGALNQGANLQAQTTTGQQSLAAQQANQSADLTAQQNNVQNEIAARTASGQEKLAALNAATSAQGGQNQAAGIAAGYGANQNTEQTKASAGAFGAIGSLLGSLSDEEVKEDVTKIGGKSSDVDWSDAEKSLLKSLYLSDTDKKREGNDPFEAIEADQADPFEKYKPDSSAELDRLMRGTIKPAPTPELYGGPRNFAPKPNPYRAEPFRSTAAWNDYTTGGGYLPPGSGGALGSASDYGRTYGMPPQSGLSDERAKEAVEKMDDKQLSHWADKVTNLPITWRYKPGVEDNGEDAHVGVLAQQLEKTGPLGKLLVHEGPDGLKRVDYGQAALMLGVALQRQMRKQKGASANG